MSDVKIAGDFMRRKLVTLAPDTKVLNGVTLLLKDNISGAPVIDASGEYLGVFSEKSCLNALTPPVELAPEMGIQLPIAREFMVRDLISLSPQIDVFDAIDHILSRRISGAPVIDEHGVFLGIFSEKTAMRVLVSAAYDQLPGTNVGSYMNTDRNRLVGEEQSLLEIAHKFQDTPYRRLPILRGEVLFGQISRRDVLRAEHHIAHLVEKAAPGKQNEQLSRCDLSAGVSTRMDVHAKTITSNDDLLAIAQIFLYSPYRRLPVVENQRLLGQVSRRDLLEAAAKLLHPKQVQVKGEPLYLSSSTSSLPPSLS